ncbi:branched-chain amino acid ABC transporter permease [Actinomadura sp. NBRC 104412]|uniref:branched-chain amino acid ABC transporter permease n=1 Tax=Actinomadura sp. NBRC 104412 TaxID=3032203 RepID=UPI0024A5D66E|nr:branched-chain amino acid ABC transporter permease [Actinomadura sp. NBRC 104412]GLZ02770.1 branched-chain amino acid ABC transporter permease [Actinomadura sp. NBRC 104412]
MDKFIALTAGGIALGAVLALVALGFLVLYKATGVINFAHGDLITLGAYIGVWTVADLGLPTIPGYVLTIVLMGLIGVLIERVAHAPLRKRPAMVVVIATLAAAIVIRGFISVWQGATPRALDSPVGGGVLRVAGANIAYQRILILIVGAIAVIALLMVFQRTAFGRQVRALAADPETAQLMGVRTKYVAMASFAMSAMLAGLAGLLVAPLGAVELNFGFGLMITAFAAAVLGGFGSLGGVVAGAMVIGIVQQLVGGYVLPEYAATYPAIVLFIVIALRPQGLFDLARSRL